MTTWYPGRQNDSYLKKLLFQLSFLSIYIDLYLIYYKTNSYILPHSDVVPGKCHWRINLIYKNCFRGGEFVCPTALLNWPRLKIFRSDLLHEVKEILSGERKVLSIGIAYPERSSSTY